MRNHVLIYFQYSTASYMSAWHNSIKPDSRLTGAISPEGSIVHVFVGKIKPSKVTSASVVVGSILRPTRSRY